MSQQQPSITVQDVQKVALLARLAISEEQAIQYQGDLSRFLEHVQTMQELNLEHVPAMSHPGSRHQALRQDTVQPSLPVELGLRGAPERLGDGFGVPKIIE